MQSKDSNGHSLNIRVKLLEENNVIIVKCPGFQTEIFMPAVIGGRLSIINVVPQRRCRCISTKFIVAKEAKRFDTTLSETISNLHLSTDFRSWQSSTPDQLRNTSIRRRSIVSKALHFGDVTSSDKILSPEQIQAAERNNKLKFVCESLQPLDQNSFDHSQLNVFSEIGPRNSTIPLGTLSSIEWPQTSLIEKESGKNSDSQTLPRWRKVLTPKRTYSRQKYTPSSYKSDKDHTDALINLTEGIKAQKTVLRRNHKNSLKIDETIRISPKSFKRQFEYKNAKELYREAHQEHKNREGQTSKKTAYELFTTPTLQSSFSQKLKTQYHARCKNKAVSTYPKYKKLARVEPTYNSRNNYLS